MSNTLTIVPSSDEVKTGVTDIQGIADGIADILADT